MARQIKGTASMTTLASQPHFYSQFAALWRVAILCLLPPAIHFGTTLLARQLGKEPNADDREQNDGASDAEAARLSKLVRRRYGADAEPSVVALGLRKAEAGRSPVRFAAYMGDRLTVIEIRDDPHHGRAFIDCGTGAPLPERN